MPDDLRVLVLTPAYVAAVGGNVTSVRRLAHGLPRRGVAVQVVDLNRPPVEGLAALMERFPPSVIHAYNASKSGPLGRSLSLERGAPLVVTCTGTDVNEDLSDPARRPETLSVLKSAAAIVVYTQNLADRILAELPETASRVHVIPKGIALERDPWEFREPLGLAPTDFVYLLPSGIRRVKGPHFCLEAMEAVAREFENVRLVVAGPVLERDFGASFLRQVSGISWARYAGTIPLDAMGTVYGQVEVVLNTSESEGMPNVILEAMSAGRAVLAAGIPGNGDLIDSGLTGLLYEPGSVPDFQRQARRLRQDENLRLRLGAAAREEVLRGHSIEAEVEAVSGIYRKCVAMRRRI